MVRSELLQKLCNLHPNLLRRDIEKILKIIFSEILDALKNGRNVEIRGFGTLSKKINKAKYVRNPKTNEKIFKKETNKIHFKIGKILHQKINFDNIVNE